MVFQFSFLCQKHALPISTSLSSHLAMVFQFSFLGLLVLYVAFDDDVPENQGLTGRFSNQFVGQNLEGNLATGDALNDELTGIVDSSRDDVAPAKLMPVLDRDTLFKRLVSIKHK
ncbi:hypothetical protein V6N11_070285 [Hibiscus sabdariffa]|uniref:Uncharacterized protein n=1 Tax=Hibiscus sabdariffa TaxID=183260 RepID=A0ABR2QEL3_9ROSI